MSIGRSDTVNTALSVAGLEQDMLECYFARRPFAAAQLGVRWAWGAVPPVAATQIDDLVARYRTLRLRIRDVLSAPLPESDRLTCRLMDEVCSDEIASLQLRSHRFTVSPLPEAGLVSAILTFLPYAAMGSKDQVSAYLQSCAQIPAVLAAYAEELAVGRENGQTPVRRLVDRSVAQLDAYLAIPLGDDPFLHPLLSAGLVDSREYRSLQTTLDCQIRPALAQMARELGSIAHSARDDDHAGISAIPGGEEAYRVLIKEHTTLPLDPAALHDTGLALVEELEREAVGIAGRLHWAGDFGAVRDRLRSDPTLAYRDAPQMLATARGAMQRAAAVVPTWITDLPRAVCEVRAMSAVETEHGVLGHYETAPLDRSRPAVYWLNTADPTSRSAFEAEALAFHESIPGHHIEIATSQEAVPGSEFRRLVQVLPYTEGWALYVERLADEIGLYSSDLARLGMVSFALWRSCRLVVDTGLHAFGWTRDRALRYLSDHTMLAEVNIANEVDRYLAHPGSALGYQVGRLAIGQLRDAVVAEPGDPGQLRAFHDGLLRRGPLSLGLMGELAGVRFRF